ncbi:hypothetical protein ACFFOO_22535 [Mucilaginibacter ginsenosidivorans]
MSSTVISAHNTVLNDPADVGEAITINIFHAATLKAGDNFTTNDIKKEGILITYSAGNADISTSVAGKQGTVT